MWNKPLRAQIANANMEQKYFTFCTIFDFQIQQVQNSILRHQ